MFLARFIAVAFLLQGVLPAFLLGVWRQDGWFLACMACLYALLAGGLWWRHRWAPLVASVLTLPQLLIFSSSWLAWRFFVGGSYGFGFSPAETFSQTRILGYRSWGAAFNFGLGHNAALLADFPGYQQRSFVLLDVLALPFLALLLIQFGFELAAAAPVPEPNRALQRTASGRYAPGGSR